MYTCQNVEKHKRKKNDLIYIRIWPKNVCKQSKHACIHVVLSKTVILLFFPSLSLCRLALLPFNFFFFFIITTRDCVCEFKNLLCSVPVSFNSLGEHQTRFISRFFFSINIRFRFTTLLVESNAWVCCCIFDLIYSLVCPLDASLMNATKCIFFSLYLSQKKGENTQ